MILKFREEDRNIFDAIRDGSKRVETRAATEKYKRVSVGDILHFSCGKDEFEKTTVRVEYFKSIDDLLKKYSPNEINPNIKNENELRKMYAGFPNYSEKIEQFGLIAIELK
jgi:ASC-1-like (ASCH) protein